MQKVEMLNLGKYGRKLIVLLIFIFSFCSFSKSESNFNSASSSSPFRLEIGNYVVAGVFRYFENAVKYSDYLFHRGFETRYGFYPAKGFYYVYLNRFQTFDEAKSVCLQFRKSRELREAWVFRVMENNEYKEITAFTTDKSKDNEINTHVTEPKDIPAQHSTNQISNPKEVEPQKTSDLSESKIFNFYFKTLDIRNHSLVKAKIDIIDPEKLKLITTVDANQSHSIGNNVSANSSLLLISQCFGYRKVERLIDLNNIQGSAADITLRGDTIDVNFEMSRLKAGDVVIMYNVYYFNNSAIMKPESRYEVNQLLQMLKENENYRIKIHGHTNGNDFGPIIKMKEDDTNFFALSRNNKEGKGSAKELSKERAATIYRYLVSEGIDKGRMKVHGWGGKKMIYEPTDSNARQNVRVEIEIVSE